MKAKLFIMAGLCAIAFTSNAQTKGTNSVSIGLGFSKQKTTQSDGNGSTTERTSKSNSVTLGYGLFFKDNEKIALDLSYGANTNGDSYNLKSYGSNLSYQKYYPIVKKLFAYVGGKGGYSYSKQNNQPSSQTNFSINEYTAGAFGGVSWFLSKRFALETNILSASLGYSKTTQTIDQSPQYVQKTENSSFGISTQGVFNDLGFKIYILF